MNLALDREMERWYPLIDHPVQLALLDAVPNGVRFPVIPSGRRSGKTERAKRFIAKEAMKNSNEVYFAAAPTYSQAKKIWWKDLKEMTFSSTHSKKPSETELIIFMDNGTEIHVFGLDKPERFEGIPWTGGAIDEIANVKESAVAENIMPALNTVNPMRPDYRAWCWFLGVPEGLNHYYDMAEYARTANDPDWKLFHWKSADILPDDVIQAAKRTMSQKQYRQEYEGSFETAGGRIYEDYSDDNLTDETIRPHEQLMWSHDQNFTPLSSSICVKRGGNFYLLDEIVLTSAISRQSAAEFVEKYKDHKNKHVLVYGDPAGRAGEKHGHASDYTDIEDVLTENGWTYTRNVRKAAPAIKDRQNKVRAKIKTAAGDVSLFVNKKTAEWCHKGLATVQLKEGSTFQEDQTNKYQHITTAIGYMIDWESEEGLIESNWSDENVTKAMTPPPRWKRWRTMFWSENRDYSIGWYARDAESGLIVRYRELSGSNGDVKSVSDSIKSLESKEKKAGLSFGQSIANEDIWAKRGHTVAALFQAQGIRWNKVPMSKPARDNAATIVLEALKQKEFKVTEDCPVFISVIPSIREDEKKPGTVESGEPCWEEFMLSMMTHRKYRPREKLPEPKNPMAFNVLTGDK